MTSEPASSPTAVAASIVVICWSIVDEFRECLDALTELVDAPAFEVIVVLNGAPAESRAIAESHAVVDRVIALNANVGFGAAANLAASVAVGDYLVFLNDDTRVDPHWLRALFDARRDGERPDVVASLILNFDGSIQEAGSRILSHGGTLQLGRGLRLEDPAAEPLLEPREVDYGSAAALMVRRELFERVGGFDPIFEPAYYEDVDLQLRVREQGGAVWFEPRARVMHHLGRSTNRDHWFRLFAANRSGRQFVSKWASVLAGAAAADDVLDALAEVPVAEREPVSGRALNVEVDDSVEIAAELARSYQDWLIEQLEEANAGAVDFPIPVGPSRRELLERNTALARRIADLEERNAFGVARMQVGIFLGRRGLFPRRRPRG